MKIDNKRIDKRKTWILGIICSMVYAVSYLGRLNYSAALPYYLDENIITKTQGGLIATMFFFTYGIGQFANGVIADHVNPEYQVIIGSLGSAIINFLMTATRRFSLILIAWTFNGLFQSMIWAPLLLLLSTSAHGEGRNGALWLLNTSPAIGAVLSYAVSSVVLRKFHWTYLFQLAGISIITCICTFCFLYKIIDGGGTSKSTLPIRYNNSIREQTKCNSKDTRYLIWGSGSAILVVPVMIHGMLKDGTTNWIPTLITEYFRTSRGSAVALAIIPQLANLFAASLAFSLHKIISNEIREVVILFALSTASILGLVLGGNYSVALSIICFACVTLSMQAANVVFVSLIAEKFQRYGMMATVSGAFNSLAYIGAALSVYIVALISNYSWILTLLFWLCSSGVALMMCCIATSKWDNYFKNGCKG